MAFDHERSRLRYAQRQQRKAEADHKWIILKEQLQNPDMYRFSRDERGIGRRLDAYIKTAWCKKSDEEKEALIREMLPCDAAFLAANNPEARVLFYRSWKCHAGALEFQGPCHLVTLAPACYARTLREAKSFDIEKIKAWASQELRRFDSIGIVEIACYSKLHGTRSDGDDDIVIAFHVHAVVVNADVAKLEAVRDRINQQHRALLEGAPAADVRPITPGTLSTVLRYMAKSPSGDYRIWRKLEEHIDSDTGEVTEQRTGRPRQRAKLAAKKLQLRVREVTARLHLDKMIFATGRGVATLKAVRRDTLQDLPWSMRSGRQHKFSGQLAEPAVPERNVLGSWVGGDDFNLEEATARAKHRYRNRQRAIRKYGAAIVKKLFDAPRMPRPRRK